MLQWALLSLEGFRLIGRRTYSFYAWSLVNLVGFAFVIAPLILASRPLASGGAPGLQLGRMLAIFVFWPLLDSVLVCAAYRSTFAPEASSFAYLRFGGAEARMALLLFLFQVVSSIAVVAATLSGPWAILIGLGAIALWARLVLFGPAVFLGGAAHLKTAWRLAGLNYRGVLVMSVVALSICVFAGVTITSAWMFATERLVRSAMTSAEFFVRILFPALTPLMMGWTAILIIAVTPAAAAYRALTEAEEDPAAEAFG